MKYEQLQKNKLAFLSGNISWLAILIASIVPIWQAGGLSFSDILFLQGLFALVLLILEVPTGVLADAMERRKVIILGHSSLIAGFLVYSQSYHFWGFFLAESTFAFGLSTLSGAEDALLWDSYKESNREDEINKVIADSRLIMTVSAAIAMVLGGIIASYDLRAPFYVGAICSLSNVVLYLRAQEPERIKLSSPKLIWIKALGSIRDKRFIKVLLLFSTSSVMLRIVFWAYIPKMQDLQVPSIWFGIVLAGANIVCSITILAMRRISEASSRLIMVSYSIMAIGLLLFIPVVNLPLLLIAIMCHQIGRGVIRVVSVVRVNQIAESEVRASVASLMSMIGSLFYVISTVSVDLLGLSKHMIMIINAVSFIVFVILWLLIDLSEQQLATIAHEIPNPSL